MCSVVVGSRQTRSAHHGATDAARGAMRFRHLARLSTAAAASSSESADIQRLARSILSAARETGNRRKLFRTKAPLDDLAAHERDLADAIAIFDDGVRRGVALHDRDTTSLLARACVVPHAKWENRERRRALFLFDCTQRRRLLNDSLLDDAGLPAPSTGGVAIFVHPSLAGPEATFDFCPIETY